MFVHPQITSLSLLKVERYPFVTGEYVSCRHSYENLHYLYTRYDLRCLQTRSIRCRVYGDDIGTIVFIFVFIFDYSIYNFNLLP